MCPESMRGCTTLRCVSRSSSLRSSSSGAICASIYRSRSFIVICTAASTDSGLGEYLLGHLGDLCSGDRADFGMQFVQTVHAVVDQATAGRTEHVALVAFHGQGDLTDVLLFRYAELPLFQFAPAYALQFVPNDREAFVRPVLVRAEIDRRYAGVAQRRETRLDAVRQPVALADGHIQQRIGRRSPEQVAQQRQRDAPVVPETVSPAAEQAVGLVTVAVQRFRERLVRSGPLARERSRRSRLRGEIAVAYFAGSAWAIRFRSPRRPSGPCCMFSPRSASSRRACISSARLCCPVCCVPRASP